MLGGAGAPSCPAALDGKTSAQVTTTAKTGAHNFFSPLLTAATVQLYASIPNAATLEYLMWEEEAPRNEQLVNPLRREGGYLPVPQTPGLGVTLNEAMVSKYPYGHWDPAGVRLRPDGSVYIR